MDTKFVERLCCPETGQVLSLEQGEFDGAGRIIRSGYLVSQDGHYRYPIRKGIARFVPEENYADNFGMQWARFSRTQLDSHSNLSVSSDRFWSSTNWNSGGIRGKWVLDVGCGSGRFAEIALLAGANVVALDYSSAVDACYENLKHYPNLHVVQGDIYALPFPQHSFDFVYSLGVLQHTPNVAKAFESLPKMLDAGGQLCVDYYEKTFWSLFLPKYWLRPLTSRIEPKKLFRILELLIPSLLFISRVLDRIPLIGRILKRIVPVANYEGIYSLDSKQLREWALLDTFDWLSPAYDQPQNVETATRWLIAANLQNIEVLKEGHLVARGTK
jgi:SAM-dependent methyltransferase